MSQSTELTLSKSNSSTLFSGIANLSLNLKENSEEEDPLFLVLKKLPDLNCPFSPIKLNPYADKVQNTSLQWAKQFKIVPEGKPYLKLCASKFTYLIAGVHPECDEKMLQIVSDWITMLFPLDDKMEKITNRVELQKFHERNIQILKREQRPIEIDDPLTFALYDLAERIGKVAKKQWNERFILHVSEYFQATLWEFENREQKKIPDVETYKKMRPYTGAAYIMFDFIELVEQIEVSNEIYHTELLTKIRLKANHVLCWSNDFMSFPKEFKGKSFHNIVHILKEEKKCTIEAALDEIIQFHNNECREFNNLTDSLSSFNTQESVVRKYVHGLHLWMGSHHQWVKETPRYQ